MKKKSNQEFDNIDDINVFFIKACKEGNLTNIKFSLTSKELYEKADINKSDDVGLYFACSNGHLEVVKYLLESPDLKWHSKLAYSARHLSDTGFYAACSAGHKDVVDYLLTKLEKNSPMIRESVQCCLFEACRDGNLKNVEYLLNDPSLKEYLDIHANDDLAFQLAATGNHLNIVYFLIKDMNIEKTLFITDMLSNDTSEEVQSRLVGKISEDFKTQVKEMFEVKEKKDEIKKDKLVAMKLR